MFSKDARIQVTFFIQQCIGSSFILCMVLLCALCSYTYIIYIHYTVYSRYSGTFCVHNVNLVCITLCSICCVTDNIIINMHYTIIIQSDLYYSRTPFVLEFCNEVVAEIFTSRTGVQSFIKFR